MRLVSTPQWKKACETSNSPHSVSFPFGKHTFNEFSVFLYPKSCLKDTKMRRCLYLTLSRTACVLLSPRLSRLLLSGNIHGAHGQGIRVISGGVYKCRKEAQYSLDIWPVQENSAPHLSRNGKNGRKWSGAKEIVFPLRYPKHTHTTNQIYAWLWASILTLLSFLVFQIDKQQFEETVRALNNMYAEAEKLGSQSYIEGCLACLTAYTVFLCMETHYEKVGFLWI